MLLLLLHFKTFNLQLFNFMNYYSTFPSCQSCTLHCPWLLKVNSLGQADSVLKGGVTTMAKLMQIFQVELLKIKTGAGKSVCSKVWHHLLFLMAKILPSFKSCLCICAAKNLSCSGDKGHMAMALDGSGTQHPVWRTTDVFQSSLQDWSLLMLKSKEWLWKEELIRLNTVTLLKIPELHQCLVSQAMVWTRFITVRISCETNITFLPTSK